MSPAHFPSPDQRLAERDRPTSRPVMRQRWTHLLFLHWEIDSALIQSTLPDGLTVDTFDGKAYLGVVPFFMERIRPVYCPPVPGVSWFQELNFRTYVYDAHGRPGVWFYSLDCNQWLAVKTARKFFNLPYQHARMSATKRDGVLTYHSARLGDDIRQTFHYPTQLIDPIVADPETLEFFLLERYRLFSVDRLGQLYSGQVHHPPYRYQHTEISGFSTWLFPLAGFDEPKTPPVSTMIAEPVSVHIHPLKRSETSL
ncbi:hypothetical protein NT6N_30370 [Oceaniferula spumae]|uniref:DUF2071 domain-containing protein n=1 Tax=Oceaniferula spumae TaxID=2979115 RepID=A0AAT9FQ24_9BACT